MSVRTEKRLRPGKRTCSALPERRLIPVEFGKNQFIELMGNGEDNEEQN